MEPRIQYARTSDGVSVACWSRGEGETLVEMPPTPFSHVAREWDFPEIRDWYTELASSRRLIRYDNRGTGLSQREPLDFSLEASIRDLDAVMDCVGVQQAALFAPANAGPVAIMYATQHPERVSHLILWCTYGRGSDFFDISRMQVLRFIADRDWRLFTETAAHERLGWREGDAADHFAELMREAVTPEAQALLMDTRRAVDVSHLLPEIRVPTLVIHRETAWTRLKASQQLAFEIPGARLVCLDGVSLAPYLGNYEEVLEVITEFLGGAASGGRPPGAQAPAALRTVLFTDIVSHAEMMSRLGDARGREVLREHERITREVLKAHGGTEVKTMGDGFMASFGSVTRAVEWAVALQKEMDALTPDPSPAAAGEGQSVGPLKIRIGLNAGGADRGGGGSVRGDGDPGVADHGASGGRGDPGGGYGARVVQRQGVLVRGPGGFVAKGFEEPIRVSEVRWRD